MKLKAQLFCLICIFSKDIYAQVGIGTINPNPNSLLDLASTDKGLLIPRVSLIATDSPLPLSEDVAGMIVYNTATVGTGINSVTPGFYVNDGTNWIRANTDADSKWVYKPGSVELMYLSDGSTERPVGSEFVSLDNGNVGIGLKTPLENLLVNGSFVTQNKITDENSDVYTTGFYSGDSLYGSGLQGTAIISMLGEDSFDPATSSITLLHMLDEARLAKFSGGAFNNDSGSESVVSLKEKEARLSTIDRVAKVTAALTLQPNEEGQGVSLEIENEDNKDLTRISYNSNRPIKFSFIDNNNHSSYSFPRTDGSAGQTLVTDGEGSLSWSSPSSGVNSPWYSNYGFTRTELSTLSDGVSSRPSGTEFVIKDNGYVGIGVDSPSETLHINGTFHSLMTFTEGTSTYNGGIYSGTNLLGSGLKGLF